MSKQVELSRWFRFWTWLVGAHPQGIGTLLVGIAALIALWQTGSLLERVLQIQSQATDISVAVRELREQSAQIQSAILLLSTQLRMTKADQTIEASSALQMESPSREEVGLALGKWISDKPSPSSPIFLPPEKKASTIEMIVKARSREERALILQRALEYDARPSVDGRMDQRR